MSKLYRTLKEQYSLREKRTKHKLALSEDLIEAFVKICTEFIIFKDSELFQKETYFLTVYLLKEEDHDNVIYFDREGIKFKINGISDNFAFNKCNMKYIEDYGRTLSWRFMNIYEPDIKLMIETLEEWTKNENQKFRD